ncbi:MAG TPA: redoxin domain-containing protein, partial [Terriglobales bacterium]|nr:redoxin domain-containing protein [Terriglobales bacterium]
MFGRPQYNYPEFKKNNLSKMMERQFGDAPDPGERAPDFELRTIDGDKIRLSDFRDHKNVVLTFGSATCPLTAASISGLRDLYDDFSDDEVEFLFVYVREAHPGEELPPHHNMGDKVQAAEILRDEEELEMPILIDDLSGKVHRKYSGQPNPTFLIDKSGRIAYRQLATDPSSLRGAIEELLDRQRERGVEHAIVQGGQDLSMPAIRPMVYAHRALERGGQRSINNFRSEFGMPGRMAVAGGRVARPVADHPVITIASAAAIAGVLGLGLWIGSELRQRRFAR